MAADGTGTLFSGGADGQILCWALNGVASAGPAQAAPVSALLFRCLPPPAATALQPAGVSVR
jgi:hypothetical protein